MALPYTITLHVKTTGDMDPALADAAPTPLLYAFMFATSLGDTVGEPPAGTPPEQWLEVQNGLLTDKLHSCFQQVPEAFRQGLMLDPDPEKSRPDGPVWDKVQSGVVSPILTDPSTPMSGGAGAGPGGPVLNPPPSPGGGAATPWQPDYGGQQILYYIGIYPFDMSLTLTRSESASNESGEVSGLQLIYAPTRTVIDPRGVRVRIEGGRRRAPEHEVTVVNHRWVFVRWSDPLPAGSLVSVSIDHQGEPLVLEERRWVVPIESVEGWERENIAVDDDSFRSAPFAGVPTLEERFEQRAELLGELKKDPLKKFKAFFFELDQLTILNPTSNAIYQKLSNALTKRTVIHRAVPNEKGVPIPLHPTFAQMIFDTSKMMRGLIEKHFTSKTGQFQKKKCEEAFERFANGELWMGDETVAAPSSTKEGVPDSANYFNFAEFALTAIEHGDANAAFWESLLNVFVRTAKIYARVYRGINPFWSSFTFLNFSKAEQAKTDFGAIRTNFPSSLTVNQLRQRFVAIARSAFGGDVYMRKPHTPSNRFSG